jgi:hypothetical protein
VFAFEKLAEQRIQEARRKGEFDNLALEGKPLVFEDDGNVPEDLRLAYKILKNADCLPPEVEIKKEIRRTEELLAAMPETSERYKTIKKLNALVLRYNMLRGGRRVDLDLPEMYEHKLVERFSRETGNAGDR